MWQPEQRENCTDSQCCRAAPPSLRRESAGAAGGWGLEPGLRRSDPERGLGLAVQKQPGQAGIWGNRKGGCRQRKHGPPQRPGATVWGVHEGRGGTWIVAFFPVHARAEGRTPPARAPGVVESRLHSPRMLRGQAWASPATKNPRTGRWPPRLHTPYTGTMISTRRGSRRRASVLKTPARQVYYTHTSYTGSLPHTNGPPRPQQITASPKLPESETYE